MSIHIEAQKGAIADVALLPGDPLRAKYIAEKHFEGAVRYNERRAAYGYTGSYQGRRVSVQATGMGVPSLSIYVHELIAVYGVTTLIRVGTCGSIQTDLEIGDIVITMAACTDSAINRRTFNGLDFAPTADFHLLKAAYDAAVDRKIPVRVGSILTCDVFYDRPDFWKIWAEHGVLGVEMESAALYTLAARHRVRALTILTVSDEIQTHKAMPGDERERSLDRMINLALETVKRAAV